jgi:folylpolyglutamate synthase/dihydropteroate synthase
MAPMHLVPPENDWMEENLEIAKKAVSQFVPNIENLDFSKLPPCRYEKQKIGGLDVLFDIAHNEDGLSRLFGKIKSDYPNRKIFCLFGTSQDKDIHFAINFLKANADEIIPFDIQNPRIMRKEDLANLFQINLEPLALSIEKALEVDALLVITGSAYIMHNAKEEIVEVINSFVTSY